MKKALFLLMLLVTTFWAGSYAAAEVRAGQVTFSPFVGAYLFDGSQLLEPGVAVGARLGYNLGRNWGVEGQFTYTQPRAEGEYGNLNALNGDLLYHFMPESGYVPYLLAGGGWMKTDTVDRSSRNGTADYGAGVKIFLDDLVALRLDVRQIISVHPQTGSQVGYWQNSLFSAGLSFQFGWSHPASRPAAETVPMPAAVVPSAPLPEPAVVQDVPLIWSAENPEVPAGKILITGLKQDKNFLEILASERIRDYRVITLSQPSRLVIEIANAVHGFKADSIAINRLGIATAAFGSFPGYLRITFTATQGRLIPYRIEETATGLKIIVTSPW